MPRLGLAVAALAVLQALAGAQSFPPMFEAVPVGPLLGTTTDLCFAPDGTAWVTEKDGMVRVLHGEQLQSAPFIDLSAEVNDDGDRGLLAIALQPGFTPDGGANSWVYLHYAVSPIPGADVPFGSAAPVGFGRLTRYRAQTDGQGVISALLGSREILLGHQLPDGTAPDAPPVIHNSHSSGALVFGTDGSLLVCTGDAAHWEVLDPGGLDPQAFDNYIDPSSGLRGPVPAAQDSGSFRSLDVDSLAGKVLRIDPSTGRGYPSNPFFDGDSNSRRSRVWALGLRNPFRACFVPGSGAQNPTLGQPGLLIVSDVGWTSWEELELVRGGDNFGWPCTEGALPQPLYTVGALPGASYPTCQDAPVGFYSAPLLTWHHSEAAYSPAIPHLDTAGAPQGGFSGNCAISGAIYQGTGYPSEYDKRLFFGDFGQGWVRTLRISPTGVPLSVHDFASNVGPVVDFAIHPIDGDLYWMVLDGHGGRIQRLRYGINHTPIAELSATPSSGGVPLAVRFDASASHDPDAQPLSYEWDFGDGQLGPGAALETHIYTVPGTYRASVRATDPLGLSSLDWVEIYVGNTAPLALITSPAQGQGIVEPTTLLLSGTGVDAEQGNADLHWNVHLHHGTHVHPDFFQADGAKVALPLDGHGDGDELVYYEIVLTATDAQGAQGSAHVFVHPLQNRVEPSSSATWIARVNELSPPSSLGGGNLDPEVARDALEPPAGALDANQQWTSLHNGEQGADDWIGWELPAGSPEAVFAGLRFQEGLHTTDGGWWQDLRVELRHAGNWQPVENSAPTPAYPVALASQPGFDGSGFDTYEFWFDPAPGDAIRLRGTPGGAAGFVSCAELRAFALGPHDASEHADLSAHGQIVARVLELSPPGPDGAGNHDPETIRNGTWPAQGSSSLWAQFDTQHAGAPAGEDWIGYRYDAPQLFARLVLQEGVHAPSGGWLADLRVQSCDSAGNWSDVGGLAVQPAAPGDSSASGSYQRYECSFAPVLAYGLRAIGTPGGGANYTSIGELRVYAPELPHGCGFEAYGATPQNPIELEGSASALGLPFAIHAHAPGGAGFGVLAISSRATEFAAFGGNVLVDPAQLLLQSFPFDANGQAVKAGSWSSDPALIGAALYAQAVWLGGPDLLLSNGLALTLCQLP